MSSGVTGQPPNPVDEKTKYTRGDRFFFEEKPTQISPERLDLTTKAFAKPLTKEKWKDLTDSYPVIKGTEDFPVAPTMEAGVKEELRRHHGYSKTKESLVFDDGLVAIIATLIVARPILAALEAIDTSTEEDEGGVDPDTIKDLLEDALVLLGNANARLKAWRQRHFSEYLTEIGKRTINSQWLVNR